MLAMNATGSFFMNQDRIIAIETSGRRGSVALGQGPKLVADVNFSANQEHARDLIPMTDRLCREHGWSPRTIKQCFLSIGPGSFTGLRVAVAFARHFALAVGAKICAVPTLDVIAENTVEIQRPPKHLAVILDAKRGEVFSAVFELHDGQYRRIIEPRMIEPAKLIATAPSPIAIMGEGIDYHRDVIEATNVEILDHALWWPRAANVHRIGWSLALQGEFTDPTRLTPFYLRRPEAEELWEKRHGTSSPESNKDG